MFYLPLQRLLTVALCSCALLACAAEEKRWLSLDQGLYSESPFLRPGKLDFLFKQRPDDRLYNAFAWSPIFKGGGGVVEQDNRPDTKFFGAFARPLAAKPKWGDLILGAQTVQAGTRDDYEFQGEYRSPIGLGAGGGFVEVPKPGNDIVFGKLTFRHNWKSWNYILEAQAQETGSTVSPGGYVALFDEQFMVVGGTDGEQWRGTLGYIAPANATMFRPAAEFLYVDNSIGDFNGPRTIFANATLRYQGGFLSNPARLGRAMGPQGLEFGNPLGFLMPTWNRRLETWEMGMLGDLRFERIRMPNGTTQERYEGLVYPFQFFDVNRWLNYIFVGGFYAKNSTRETPGIIGGITGKVGFLNLSFGVDHEVDPARTSYIVGLIDWF